MYIPSRHTAPVSWALDPKEKYLAGTFVAVIRNAV